MAWARDTKCGTNVSNKMLLGTTKYRSYSSYCTELLRENQHGTCKISIKPKLGLKDFKDDIGEEAGLEFRWRQIDEIKDYV